MSAPVEVRALVRCRCGKCHGNPDAKPHEDSVTLVGRDALVMELGRATAAYNRAIDVWAPLHESRAVGWREALDAMEAARDALGVAGTALRTWDAGTEGGGT